ncbi:RNA-directed DNA polymerase, eukaryota [Tanacetum coccineum]
MASISSAVATVSRAAPAQASMVAPFTGLKSKVDELDRAVSRDEIRRAVWNCGENKSPGPRDSVANKMGASSVSASFRRDVRDGAERQQWDDLSSILNSDVLSSSKDRWT